jgi:hypothetical protein
MLNFCIPEFFRYVLIVAVAVMATLPAVGPCIEQNGQCGTSCCCGACSEPTSESTASCCSKRARPQVCCCSKDERPAAPLERQASAERTDLFRAVEQTVLRVIHGDDLQRSQIEETVLRSFPPSSCQQALLCCWLI